MSYARKSSPTPLQFVMLGSRPLARPIHIIENQQLFMTTATFDYSHLTTADLNSADPTQHTFFLVCPTSRPTIVYFGRPSLPLRSPGRRPSHTRRAAIIYR